MPDVKKFYFTGVPLPQTLLTIAIAKNDLTAEVRALDTGEIICGHTHCGAMKELLQLDSIADDLPLVGDWLK